MFTVAFSARLGTSHLGPPHPFKDARVLADSLTGIHSAPLRCQRELRTQKLFGVPTGKNLENSNQASVETM
jgi:hypothetical protein